jgi:protein TonB
LLQSFQTLTDRLRDRFGARAMAIAFALAVELLFVLILLTLAPQLVKRKEPVPITVVGISPEAEADPEADSPEPAKPAARAPAPSRAQPQPAQPAETTPETPPPDPVPAPPTPPMLNIPLSRIPDIASLPRAPAAPAAPRRAAGPPNLAVLPGDSQRVGSAPNGQPLYAASWYREPYPSELRGYLSTAQGPGWGTIACRTIADYRVDSCVLEGEYPDGSRIGRAVLAAAWQFRVRPPRIGGQSQVGEWVRIRINYELRASRGPGEAP